MKIGDVPDDVLLGMLSGRIPMEAKTEWEVAVDILRGARLPLRRGMLLVNGCVVVRGEEGHDPRVPGARVLFANDIELCEWSRWTGVSWRYDDGIGALDLTPDIRDPWTARMVWHDLHARFAGEDRSKTPNHDQILALIVATGGHEKLTMDERKERHRAVVEEQQAARETGKGRTL